jgi:hypothetical protein
MEATSIAIITATRSRLSGICRKKGRTVALKKYITVITTPDANANLCRAGAGPDIAKTPGSGCG